MTEESYSEDVYFKKEEEKKKSQAVVKSAWATWHFASAINECSWILE